MNKLRRRLVLLADSVYEPLMHPAFSFWPLLLVIAALAVVVWLISPANLKIIPYKLLIVCIAVYLSHRLDSRFFKRKVPYETELSGAIADVARALIFGFTVIGLSYAL